MFRGSTQPASCSQTVNRTGLTQTIYNADLTDVIDPAGIRNRQRIDGVGNVVEVVEDPLGLNHSTTYTYDVTGHLTLVTRGVQTRTFVYSSLSRLLSSTQPESGTTTFTYNDDGSLKRRTDARNRWTEHNYDPLGRILAKTYSDDTPAMTYEYHLTGAPWIGRLKLISSSSAASYYEYDALGNVTTSVHGIDGFTGWREFSYDWYLNGRLRTQVYPSGKTVEYGVDDAGRTNKVYTIGKTYVDMTPASGATQPFTADGRVAQMKLGNNRWETRQYSLPGPLRRFQEITLPNLPKVSH